MDLDGLDPVAILETLGVEGGVAVARVLGGWDTALWRVGHAGSVWALRVFRAEQVETCRREVVTMRAVASVGIPVPAIHREATWRGHPVLLLSWCDGRPLLTELLARPWQAWALGRAFGQLQARIHAVPPPEGLRGWDEAWIRWVGGGEAELLERLRAIAPRWGTLMHLDYHPLNVMTDRRRVSGVLDWANAAAGDPRLDVARTVTILRLAPTPPTGSLGLARPLRRAFELSWRRGYQQTSGPLSNMPLFYAAAGAIMERDLAPKVGRPGIWLKPAHLDQVRRWTTRWKKQIGIARQ